MKKKLVFLLFCSLLVLQSSALFSVQAGDTEPDYKALPTNSQRSPLHEYPIRNKKLICSHIGDNFVYVYKNPSMPSNAQWTIFKSPNNPDGSDGKYICYQSINPLQDDRNRIIAAIERFSSCSVCSIGQFLTYRENVVLEIDS